MKFQNPDTNQIFVDICDAYTDFCNSRDCDTDCPLDAPTYKEGYEFCSVWAIHHPVEAAHLMGYEVLEDDFNYYEGLKSSLEEAIAYKEGKPNDCSAVTIELEEANMDKPRICEVLGVEVEEKFDAGPYKDAYIDLFGIIRTNIGSLMDTDRVCELINHPDHIIRKPRWTKQEVEEAKTIRRVFGRDGTIKRTHDIGERSTLVFNHLYINANLLPSLQPGHSVKLSEICGGIHDFD